MLCMDCRAPTLHLLDLAIYQATSTSGTESKMVVVTSLARQGERSLAPEFPASYACVPVFVLVFAELWSHNFVSKLPVIPRMMHWVTVM